MANTLMSLLVKIGADTSGLTNGLKDAQSQSTMSSAAIVKGLSSIGGVAVTAGLIAATVGIIALGKGLYDCTKEAMAAEEVQAQLEAVIKSTGGVAGVTSKQVNDLADKFSKLTKFDDEAIVSAESLLLTFTNIGQDVFPQATETILNMSQALGQDLSSSAIQLGKALQDPILGITALRRVGVNFSDAQKDIITGLVEAGKLEEAQAMILKELQVEFGGAAEAAGQTFAGQLAIMNTQFGNIKESVGTALLPVLSDLANMFSNYLSKPETQAAIAGIATTIGEFAKTAIDKLPAVIESFKAVFGWLSDNRGVIVGALSAIGVAISAFVYTTVIPAIVAIAPLIAIMAVLGAAGYLLYTAWTQNWGGIQEITASVWAWLQPILQNLWTWLSVNIPVALTWLSVMWTTVLLPAIMAVWGFVQNSLWPMLVALGVFLVEVFGVALMGMSAIWQNILLPAITAVWGFISNSLWPLFVSIAGFLGAVFGVALMGLAGIWQDILAPALSVAWDWLTKVYNIIKGPVMEYVQRLARVLVGDLATGIQTASDTLSGLQKIFNRIAGAIASAIKKIREFIDALTTAMSMDLGNFEPGSPTPFEMGLTGINQAMSQLVNLRLPQLTAGLELLPAAPTGNFAMQTMGGGSVPSSPINVEVNAQVASDIDIETLAYRIADVIARRI
jgi:hypothetical protein